LNSDELKHSVAAERNRLLTVLLVITVYFAAELIGGYLANSLALLSDAVHMLTDIGAVGLSLLTHWISTRPPQGSKTYGYMRAEILGALLNGLILWLLVLFIWYEAIQRLRHPEPVAGLSVMIIAAVGLLVNSFSAWTTFDSAQHAPTGMAIRSVFVHALCDLIATCGVLIAGACAYFTGWTRADPAASLWIGVLVLYSSWGLVKDGIDILMESVPSHIDLDELRQDMLAVNGTSEVHDLHVWCLTTHQLALSAHAVVQQGADHDQVLADMSRMLERKFRIRHMTVQLEYGNRRDREPQHF
jgi:cobalt-zinc-cadmium efflux system protein